MPIHMTRKASALAGFGEPYHLEPARVPDRNGSLRRGPTFWAVLCANRGMMCA